MLRLLLVVALVGAGWWAAPHVIDGIARYQVRSALTEAGVSERNADCMAQRMVKRLTIAQLRKLEAVEGEKKSLPGMIRSVRKIDDGEVVAVTVSSSLLCRTGLANESKDPA
jgi:hypothetical protein